MDHEFIATAPTSLRLLNALRLAARHQEPVWLVGSAGTGRGHAARHLHASSERRFQPCVEVDCAALDAAQAQVALQGCEAGAVTGVFSTRPGWFELAHGGSLVLKEVHCLPMVQQRRLAEFLSDGTVQRLGGHRLTVLNTRLLLASTRTPGEWVEAGRLHPLLAEQLRGEVLQVPDLAERASDIAPLAERLLVHHSRCLQRQPPRFTAAAWASVSAHRWLDNLRELDAWIQQVLIRISGDLVDAHDLDIDKAPNTLARLESFDTPELLDQFTQSLRQVLTRHPGQAHAVVEELLFKAAYDQCQQHQIKAADLLGVSRNVLRARLIRHGTIKARG